jgi:hypothetical protein
MLFLNNGKKTYKLAIIFALVLLVDKRDWEAFLSTSLFLLISG